MRKNVKIGIAWSKVFLLLFESENVIDALHEEQNQRLPSDEVSNPVEELTVEQVRLLPGIFEQFLEVDLLLAVRANLLLADNEPTTNAKSEHEKRVNSISSRIKSIKTHS